MCIVGMLEGVSINKILKDFINNYCWKNVGNYGINYLLSEVEKMGVNLILMIIILAMLFLLLLSLVMFGSLIKHSLKKLSEKDSVVNNNTSTKIEKQDNKVLVLSEALESAENLRKAIESKIFALKKDLAENK